MAMPAQAHQTADMAQPLLRTVMGWPGALTARGWQGAPTAVGHGTKQDRKRRVCMPTAARIATGAPIKQDREAAARIAMAAQVAMHTAASVAALVCNPLTVSQMFKPQTLLIA